MSLRQPTWVLVWDAGNSSSCPAFCQDKPKLQQSHAGMSCSLAIEASLLSAVVMGSYLLIP
jgi:hypothetical protein